MPEIFLHSWNYRDYPLETAIQRAHKFGYDGIEIFAGHYPDESDPVSGMKYAQLLAERGKIPIAVAPLSLDVLTCSKDDRNRAMDTAVMVIEAAGQLGIPRLNAMIGWLPSQSDIPNLDGSAVATTEHFELAINLTNTLANAAGAAMVEITLETHMRTIHDTAKAAGHILDRVASASLRANLDPGNMYSCAHAEGPKKAVRQLAKYLTYVHLKNCRNVHGQFDYHSPLATGDIDYRRVVQTMMANGFRGPYCIEYSGAGDRDYASQRDIEYFRSLLADFDAE
jgi:sugar phosphate isomerase/epimerase